MARVVRKRVLFAVCWFLVGCTLNVGCASDDGPVLNKEESRISWDSPRMLSLQKEWEKLATTLSKTANKATYEEHGEALDSLIRKRLSNKDLQDLADSCSTLSVCRQERSGFVNGVLELMVIVFVDLGDRGSLVTLLSTRCPDRIYLYNDIELYLAMQGKNLKDPILILGDAYARCRVPEVRTNIATAVRRGFSGCGVLGKDDDEVVANAMKWYEQNKENIEINLRYIDNTRRPRANYAENPLFVKRHAGPPTADNHGK